MEVGTYCFIITLDLSTGEAGDYTRRETYVDTITIGEVMGFMDLFDLVIEKTMQHHRSREDEFFLYSEEPVIIFLSITPN